MPVTDTRKADMAIEDDLNLLHSAAGVLYLACGYLEDRREGESALATSLHFAATSIKAVVDRVEAKLCHDKNEAEDASCP
jgi:hypothetical protein